jgi:hypothetical protein
MTATSQAAHSQSIKSRKVTPVHVIDSHSA